MRAVREASRVTWRVPLQSDQVCAQTVRFESIDRAFLNRCFCRQRKKRLLHLVVLHAIGRIFSHRRTMLEAVARATADQPDILKSRMLIDEEIAVGSVFILADARFDDRRVLQSWKTAREILARGSSSFRAGDARLRVGIGGFAVAVKGDFETAAFDIGHTVVFVVQIDPRGHRRLSEAGGAGGYAKEKNFLPSRKNTAATTSGKTCDNQGQQAKTYVPAEIRSP